MLITLDWLNEKGACSAGKRWFEEHFPEGGEYQDVLNALAAENSASWGQWLLQAAGPVDTVLEVNEINTDASLFFAGRIIVKGALIVARYLFAGRSIVAGEGIKAGRSISAGECINAGWGIKADHGIVAGEGINAGEGIEAGWNIKAGHGIKAGGSIVAGEGIKAGGSIEAGCDYGIYAGLRVRISHKKEYATIRAKEKPENIVCGEWVGN